VGTIQVAPVTLAGSTKDNLKATGSRIVFAQSRGNGGLISYELWGSDGTPEGTRLLQNLGHGSSQLASIDGLVYFAGTDDVHGNEVWTTDGTAEGTKLLVDVNPGAASSSPYGFAKVGNTIYFSAYTNATGGELWALPLTVPSLSINDTRTTEGDTGATPARFMVSLQPAAKQTVTVDYSTSDGTAVAGQDYDATTGTLTFAPGETSKTINVPVRGDVFPENNETFFVTLHNAKGGGIVRSEGTGIIDDDDQFADLSIAPRFAVGGSGLETVEISNRGPRTATASPRISPPRPHMAAPYASPVRFHRSQQGPRTAARDPSICSVSRSTSAQQ
jgi:ELWxxDGT repeat protein